MAGKQEFSAVVVKAFKSFFQIFSVPDGESGQSWAESASSRHLSDWFGSLELEIPMSISSDKHDTSILIRTV